MTTESTEKTNQNKGRPANVAVIVTGTDGVERVIGFQPKALRDVLKGSKRIPVDPGVRGTVVVARAVVEGGEMVVSGDTEAIRATLLPKNGEASEGEKAALKSENATLKADMEKQAALLAALMAKLEAAGITL